MTRWDVIAQRIGEASGLPFSIRGTSPAGGGCINSAYRLQGEDRTLFVKTNSADRLEMFEAEAEGLAELGTADSVRVPEPVCTGVAGNEAFLVLEDLALGGDSPPGRFGEQLAALHRVVAERFGWHRDNTIGSTLQRNDWDRDWVRFWRERRLGFQLELAARNGAGRRLLHQGEQLLERFPALFDTYHPRPSLLHGDLWGGNYGVTQTGEPVIFDPATYYGDREADLAMTELFGGFPGGFYAAYAAAWPLDDGYGVRKTLYNLYHILNHFNLFGGGYRAQAEGMMGRLLSELR